MSGSIAGTSKRAILGLRRLVRDVLPDAVQGADMADDDPTDQVPVLDLDKAARRVPDTAGQSDAPTPGPSSPEEPDAVRRLAESTGVPLANLTQESRQAAARQLEAELHQRLARWMRLEDELRRQKADTEKLVSSLDASRIAVLTLEATVQRLTAEGEDARQQIQALQEQIAAERSAVNSTSEIKSALEAETRTLRQSLEEQSRRLAVDSDRLGTATRELESYKDALLGLQATLREQQAVTDQHEREKAALAATVADLEAALAKLRAQHRDEAAEREALRNKAKQAEAAIASQQTAAGAELARLQGVCNEEQKKSAVLAKEVGRWESAAARAEEARDGLSEVARRLERSVAERQGKVEELEKRLAERLASLTAADEQVKALHVREGQLLLRIEECEHELERRLEQVDSLTQLGEKLAAERDQQRALSNGLNDEIRKQKKLLEVLGSGMPNMEEIAATVTTLDSWVNSQIDPDCVQTGGKGSGYRMIEELNGSQATKHLLEKEIFTIGRSANCDLRVRGPYTSRQHARILNQDSRVVIEDLGSANGIEVNQERVESCVLHDGDIVEIGGTRFRFVEHAVAHHRTLDS